MGTNASHVIDTAPDARVDWSIHEDLAGAAARGGIVTAGGTWIRFVIQLLTVIVIARLLGPVEYGFAAVVLVFSTLSDLLRNSGFASAILQRRDLTGQIASALFYASAAIGLVLGVMLVAAGPALASLFGDPRYAEFATLAAVVMPLAGIAAVPTALLTRNLAFRALAVVEVSAVVVSSAIGIVLALCGAGAVSLVWQAVSLALIICVGTVLVSPWRPGRPATRSALAPYLRFGGNVAIVQILRYASQNVDRLLIAAQFGPAATGVYAQANQLILLPVAQINGPLTRVVIPVLGRLVDDAERFCRYFRTVVGLVGFTLWPVFAVMVVLSEDIILSLFGPEWAGSAEIFRILVVAGLANTLIFVNSWIFVSTGSVRRQSIWTAVSAPLLIGGACIGALWGVDGVAMGVAAASLAIVLPGFVVASHRTPLGIGDLLGPLGWPTLVTVVVGAATVAVTLTGLSGWLLVLVGGITAVIAYAMCAFLIPPVRRELVGVISRLRR